MGAETAEDLLGAGREALAAADWDRARSCFERARDLGETAEVLDGLSHAAHFQGEYDRAIELKERAFALYRRDGRRVEAAEPARWLAFLHGALHGNMAAANGWMARARSLLDGLEEWAARTGGSRSTARRGRATRPRCRAERAARTSRPPTRTGPCSTSSGTT
jgi:tetratricopeptide (TPR) repeat protein